MKIIISKKYANIWGDRDPYKVDFTHESEKAKGMGTDSLFFALSDAIEASQVSVNEGKYYDQASVYRQELKSRGFSFDEQDRKLKTIPSLHTTSQSSTEKEQLMAKALDLIFKDKMDVSQAFESIFSQDDLFNGTVTELYNRVKQDPRYLR